MVILIIVFGLLLLLSLYGLFAHTSTRLYFLEKQPEVIDFVEVYNDFDYPELLTGYKPVVRFEVKGKVYQGTAHVLPLWQKKEKKPITILYNPQDPSEFQVRESSTSPATGCMFVIIIVLAFAITLYFYVNE
jgi:hypothetical protein